MTQPSGGTSRTQGTRLSAPLPPFLVSAQWPPFSLWGMAPSWGRKLTAGRFLNPTLETSKAGLQCPGWVRVSVASLWPEKLSLYHWGLPQGSGGKGVQRGVLFLHKNGVPGKHHGPLGWPQVFSCLSSLSASLPFSLSSSPSFKCHPGNGPRPFAAWPSTAAARPGSAAAATQASPPPLERTRHALASGPWQGHSCSRRKGVFLFLYIF